MPEKSDKADSLARDIPSQEAESPVQVKETVIEPEVPAVEVPEQPPIKLRVIADFPFDEVKVAVPNSADRIEITKDGVEVESGPEAQHLLDVPYIEVAD